MRNVLASRFEGVADVLESSFGEALLVEGEAADQVVAQSVGGPLAKAHAASRIDPVADGDAGVEVVVPDAPSELARAFGPNY